MPTPAPVRPALLTLAAMLTVAGCASTGGGPGEPVGVGGLGDAPTADPSSSTAVSISAGPTQAGATAGTRPGGGDTGSTGGQPAPKPHTTAPAYNGPTILYFRVAQKPSCPGGTTANPVSGSPVVLEWKVSNVDSVALSVDGPGIYGDGYPPTGSETLNFPCSGQEGATQRHTYLLTVRNAAGKQTRTLVVSATVHVVTPV